jgi:tetratricopeptide (TPR) repeat protein
MRLGRKTDAVEEYKKAMALKQKYFDATLKLGAAYYELENYPEAIKVYTDAITMKNDSADAYVGRGDTYRQMKEFNKAASDYNLALTFIVRDKNLKTEEASDVYLMHAYMIDRQCDINKVQALPCQWNAAIRSLEAAAALTQRPEDYANLGAVYYKAGKFDKDRGNPDARARLEKARFNLERVLAVNPPVKFIDTPRFNLGLTLLDLDDYPGAIQQLQKVVDSLPDATYPLNELGAAYYFSKNYKEASRIFRKVIAKDDKSVRAYINLALSEFYGGNKGEAKKAYEKLKQLSPQQAKLVDVETRGAISK